MPNFTFPLLFWKIGMGHPTGSLQSKISTQILHILRLHQNFDYHSKFQPSTTIFKNQCGSQIFNIWGHIMIFRPHLHQYATFHQLWNFEKISNLRVPPSLDKSVGVFLTPTGPNLFRSNPSSNSVIALPIYEFPPNLVKIGQLVRKLWRVIRKESMVT